jgi:hypothetical protein
MYTNKVKKIAAVHDLRKWTHAAIKEETAASSPQKAKTSLRNPLPSSWAGKT